MAFDSHRPIGEWLHALLPDVDPLPWPDGCWIATVKTRTAEHHPPLYWLGRALDAAAAAGHLEAMRQLLLAAHGSEACNGWSEQDQRAQDILTVACALAWAGEHLGPARLLDAPPAAETPAAPLVEVPSLGAALAPHRLWPVRTMEQLMAQVRDRVDQAACALPAEAAHRLVYLDVPLNLRGWSYDLGYDAVLTDPLRAATAHFAAEAGLGYVLTRPFQWGAPIEAWY